MKIVIGRYQGLQHLMFGRYAHTMQTLFKYGYFSMYPIKRSRHSKDIEL